MKLEHRKISRGRRFVERVEGTHRVALAVIEPKKIDGFWYYWTYPVNPEFGLDFEPRNFASMQEAEAYVSGQLRF